MKVSVFGNSSLDTLPARAQSKLEGLVGRGADIIVGDSSPFDALVQQHLAAMGYSEVTVFSVKGRPGYNVGDWDVRHVESASQRSRCKCQNDFIIGKETLHGFARSTDRCLVFWDGGDADALAAVIYSVVYGKPSDVVLPNGEEAVVVSLDDLRGLLPERNPHHRRYDVNIPMRDQWEVVAERFIPSQSIAERLAMAPIWKWKVVDIILGSPKSLKAKAEALGLLSRYDDVLHEIVDKVEKRLRNEGKCKSPADKVSAVDVEWNLVIRNSFTTHRNAIREALDALESTGPGELVYRKSIWDERPELFEEHEQGIAPFSSIDAALEDLRFEMKRDEWDDDAPFWSSFEKWRLSPDGTWENPFTYYAIKDEIVFFERNCYDEEEHYWASEDRTYGGSSAPDLNLRVPFGVGDVVTIDCRPFAPLRHGIVLEPEREGRAECCMPRMLLLDDYESKRKGELIWDNVSPKHAGGLNLGLRGYSPLYNMELYEGALPEEERIISEVREWLGGNAEKGKKLSDAMMFSFSEDDLRAFIEGN